MTSRPTAEYYKRAKKRARLVKVSRLSLLSKHAERREAYWDRREERMEATHAH